MVSLTADIALQLVGIKTAHEAWTKLAMLHDSQAFAQRYFLDQPWREMTKGEQTMDL